MFIAKNKNFALKSGLLRLIFVFCLLISSPSKLHAWETLHHVIPGISIDLMNPGPLKDILIEKREEANSIGHSCDVYEKHYKKASKNLLPDGSVNCSAFISGLKNASNYKYLAETTHCNIGYVSGHRAYNWDWYVRSIAGELNKPAPDALKIALMCGAITHFMEFYFPEKPGEYGGIDTKFKQGKISEQDVEIGVRRYINKAELQWSLDEALEKITARIALDIAPNYNRNNDEDNYKYLAQDILLITIVYNEAQRSGDHYYDRNSKALLFVNRAPFSASFDYKIFKYLSQNGYRWDAVTGDYTPDFSQYDVVFIKEGWAFNNTVDFYDSLEKYARSGGHVMISYANKNPFVPNMISSWDTSYYTRSGNIAPASYKRLIRLSNVDVGTNYHFYGKNGRNFLKNMDRYTRYKSIKKKIDKR